MQLTFEGKTIDQLAIELIQAYEPPNGYYLGFSGGKDSCVILHLARRAKVKFIPVYNVSPIDSQLVRQFIKNNYPEVIWENHAQGFFNKHFMSLGLPTRFSRWCCRIIKEAGGNGHIKILGMRKAESLKRSKYDCFSLERQQLLPILNWSDSDIWQYIAEHQIAVSSLYRHGFSRIGCVLCPYSTKADIGISLKMFPEVVNLWRKACDRYIQKRIERGTPMTFKTGEEYFNWWIKR